MVGAGRRRLFLAAILLIAGVGAALARSERVYVTRTGAKYHRASCHSLRSSRIEMPLAEAAVRLQAAGPGCDYPCPSGGCAHDANGSDYLD